MATTRKAWIKIVYDGTNETASGSGSSDTASSSETSSETASTSTSSSTGGQSYTVVSGDTLWRIAKQFYGSGQQYTKIYEANAELIEATAKQHGKSSSGNGHWIWPGEVLTIPGTEDTEESSSSSATSTETSATQGDFDTSGSVLGDKIANAASSFTYTDVASGESDSISIDIHDIGKEWIGSLMPQKGASLQAEIRTENWDSDTEGEKRFNCGRFILDDISFSGRPLNCVLGGVSVPTNNDFKSRQKTKTWEKTTIKEIASEITAAAGVALTYDADDVQIAELEQNRETDSAFLYSLCEKYGLAMKVYNHIIVIFDIIRYEKKDAILTLKETDMLSWSYNTSIDGTYTGVELSYTDPDNDKPINVTIGSEGRMYSLNTQAANQYDAELQAAAKANEANRKIETMEITLRAKTNVVASHCVNIYGLGNIDGKYYIDKVKRDVGKSYKMQVTLHKVQKPVQEIEASTSASSSTSGQSYTVVSGDTLWRIAKQFYGSGQQYTKIYEANAELIEATAKQHGKSSSGNGHWIWPGEVLTIPEA